MRLIGLAVALAVSLVLAPLAAEGQQPKVSTIGVLGNSRTGLEIDGLQQGLRDEGYVEGRNLLVERRFAEGEGREDRLRSLADELINRKVDLIVTVGGTAIAAKSATTTIPIVFMLFGDPIGVGLVTNLARPAGNVTGFTHLGAELAQKRLELLKEALPTLKVISVLHDSSTATNAMILRESKVAADRLRVEVRLVEITDPSELGNAFQVRQARSGALVVVPGILMQANRVRIVELATRHRLPLIGWHRDFAESGGLLSYGADHFDIGRRAAGYIAKILKGAKPADLPVEQPTKFELVVNLKTAKALGLTIPQTILLQADKVIE